MIAPVSSARIKTRIATLEDYSVIAGIFTPSRRLLDFLPERYGGAEDRWFIANIILRECDVTLASLDGAPAAFLAREGSEIRLIHTHPNCLNNGLGAHLIKRVKQTGERVLELWCFQKNWGARRFYERHGFKPIEHTDGAGNQEGEPDIRYRWTAP